MGKTKWSLHTFLLNWRNTVCDGETMAWESVAPFAISFNRQGLPTRFKCEAPMRDPDDRWSELNHGEWVAEMDQGVLETGLDDLQSAMAVCEAKFVEWLIPALFNTDSELNEAAVKLMEARGGRTAFTKA